MFIEKSQEKGYTFRLLIGFFFMKNKKDKVRAQLQLFLVTKMIVQKMKTMFTMKLCKFNTSY